MDRKSLSAQRRRTILSSILLVLLLLVAGWLGFSQSPRARWQRRIIGLKWLGGPFAHVGWLDTLRLACSFYVGHMEMLPAPLNRLEAVRARQQGEEPCPVLWDTPMGAFWGRRDQQALLWALTVEQLVEQAYHREPVVVRKGDVVVDAGSHLGTFTRFALNHGARAVVSFEPEPLNTACFKRTFQQEMRDGRVILVEAALWDKSGTVDFWRPAPDNSMAGSVQAVSGSPGQVAVPAATLDETVARLKLQRADFIKMDIEGAEREALLGGRETLSRFGPRMVLCIYHKPDDRSLIPQLVLETRPGYRIFTGPYHAYCY